MALSSGPLYGQSSPVILVSSAALTFKAALGQDPDSQSVLVASSGTALPLSATVSTSAGGDWLQYSFDGATTPANLRVTAKASSLQAGTYQGQIMVSAAGSSNSPLAVTVTLTIASGTGPAALTATPMVLNFAVQLNGTAPPAQVISVGPGDASAGFTVMVSTGAVSTPWLLVTPMSGTTPQSLAVSVALDGLAGGSYNGAITIVPKAAGTNPVTVAVNLTVNSLPNLNVSPLPGFQFYFQQGSSVLTQAQALTLSTSAGALTMTLKASTASGTPWLVVGQTVAVVGTSAIQIPVSISPIVSTFPAGTYSGSILISAPGAANAAVGIPVTLQVTTLPLIGLNSPPVPFAFRVGLAPPAPQPVEIDVSRGNLPYSATVVLSPGQNWLTVSPDLGTLPMVLALAVDATGLVTGTYSGQVRIDSTGAANTPLIFPVTLSVAANGLLVPSQGQLDFNYQIGLATPTPQTLGIGTAGGDATFTIRTVTNFCGTNWLSVTPSSGSTPAKVKVSINPQGLTTPTLCQGRLDLINQTGIQTLIPVNLTVSNDPLMNVSPALFTFSGAANGVAPPGQTLQLASTDVNNPLFYAASVSTSLGGNWLSINSGASGQTPGSIQLLVNQGSLAAGTYSGLVEIRPTGLPPVRIPVTLIVSSNVSLGVLPPSLSFAAAAGTSPAPQLLNVTSQGGPLTFSLSAQSSTNWLSVSPTSGTTPGQLVVSADTTGLAPGTYDASVTIASSQASNPVVTVPVSLTVGIPQMLTVTPSTLGFRSTVGDPAPASQTVTLTPSVGAVDFTATAQVTGSVPWLKVTPSLGTAQAGSAPRTLTVTVDPAGLNQAVSAGSITITPKGLPQVVLTVTYTYAPPPLPMVGSIVNAASLVDGGAIAPGEIVVLRGANIGVVGDTVVAQPNADGSLPIAIGDTQILFDTYFAPLISVENNQATVVVPYELAGQTSTLIQAKRKSVFSNLLQVPVAQAAIGVFTKPVPIPKVGAILNVDGTTNTPENPATPGTAVTVFYTGDGQTNPPTATNSVNPASGPQAAAGLLLTATIGGSTAMVNAYGPTPGSFAGLSTAVIAIPSLLGPGPQALVLSTDPSSSQAGVFVYLKN